MFIARQSCDRYNGWQPMLRVLRVASFPGYVECVSSSWGGVCGQYEAVGT